MNQDGLSLIELLTTMTVIAIMLIIGPPALDHIKSKMASNTTVFELRSAYQLARSFAVTHNIPVYFCGSNDGKHCEKKWRKHVIAFTDTNRNRQFDSSDHIIFNKTINLNKAHITSRIAAGKPFTVISEIGSVKYPGSMLYCTEDNNPKYANRVTWNKLGRPYLGIDKNKDGFIEDTQKKRIQCS